MSHNAIRCFLALLCAALAIAAAPVRAQMPAWEKQLYEAAKKEKQFTVYTAHYNTEEASRLCDAFEKKYPGVKCNFVRTTAQVAFQRFQQDLQANAPVASVFSSTDVSHYPDLKKRGIVNNWATLQNRIRKFGFPPGRLIGPNSRGWDQDEVEAWIAEQPTAPKPTPRRRHKSNTHEITRDT